MKGRQGVTKRRGKPRDQPTMTPSVLTSWGSTGSATKRRGATSRPGSWTDAESRDGSPGNLEGPGTARRETAGYGRAGGPRLPARRQACMALGARRRTRIGKQPADPADEPISRRACMAGSRSALIVPMKAGNRGQRGLPGRRKIPFAFRASFRRCSAMSTCTKYSTDGSLK